MFGYLFFFFRFFNVLDKGFKLILIGFLYFIEIYSVYLFMKNKGIMEFEIGEVFKK